MLNHIKGNLIDLAEAGEFDVIVHGCNCQITMGAGIAKEIRERYPEAYAADFYFDRDEDGRHGLPVLKLGNYSFTRNEWRNHGKFFTIVNAYTQVHYAPRGIDHFEYESFMLILRKLAAVYPNKRFGFPYIGCGLAGGDKKRIVAMLENFAKEISTTGGTATLVEFG